MKILGIDNGYNFTKTSKGVCFTSTIKEGHDDFNDVLEISIDGETYVVGETNGLYVTDKDKLSSSGNKLHLRICTLTSIALSYPNEKEIEVTVIAGLPVSYFSDQKDAFRSELLNMGNTIKINKHESEQKIIIKDVIVFPQSAGVVFKQYSDRPAISEERSIIIDIGGGTWDISEFEGLTMTQKGTYSKGMLVLYEELALYLNSKYYSNYSAEDMYKLLKRNYITIEGVQHNLNELQPIIKDYVSNIMPTLSRKFDLTVVDNVFLIGGGANELYRHLVEHIKGLTKLENSQFTNANSFEYMGRLKLNS